MGGHKNLLQRKLDLEEGERKKLHLRLRMHHLNLNPNCKVKHKEEPGALLVRQMADPELLPHGPDKRIPITRYAIDDQEAV